MMYSFIIQCSYCKPGVIVIFCFFIRLFQIRSWDKDRAAHQQDSVCGGNSYASLQRNHIWWWFHLENQQHFIFRMVSDNNITKTNFSSNRIHIDPAAPRNLTIHQIQASDAGNYSCFPAVMRWTLTVTGYYTISFIFIWTRKTVYVYN